MRRPLLASSSARRARSQSDVASECPQRDSNPRYHLERVATWAASRWGPGTGRIAAAYAPPVPPGWRAVRFWHGPKDLGRAARSDLLEVARGLGGDAAVAGAVGDRCTR